MKINTRIPVEECWRMVNSIWDGNTPDEIRMRCLAAESYLKANEIISDDEYDDLMMAVSSLYRESYHI